MSPLIYSTDVCRSKFGSLPNQTASSGLLSHRTQGEAKPCLEPRAALADGCQVPQSMEHVIHVPSFPWKWKGVVKNIIFAYFFASVCFGIWGICLYLNELSAIISYLFLGSSIAFPHDLPPGKPRPAGNYSARSCVAPRPRYLESWLTKGGALMEDFRNKMGLRKKKIYLMVIIMIIPYIHSYLYMSG